ncbi:MAG: hypothetical protein ACPG48_07475, partial [Candidatus Puniceispirillaceae bacterium]
NAALGVALDAGRLTPEIDQLVEDGIGDEGSAWLVRLAVIAQPGDAASLSARLRLSRRDSHFLATLDRDQPEADVGSLTGTIWQQSAWWLWRAGSAPAACLVVAGGRAGRQIEMPQLARLAAWVPPEFPLAGADLLSHGVDSGPALGEMLRTAEREWVDRDFVPTRAELLVFLGLDPVA